MKLASVRLVHLGPFGEVTVPFTEEDGSTRAVTVLFGGGGVGKTTLLGAIAATRPGYAVALATMGDDAPLVVTEWSLGDDDRERPHPLRLATPTGRAFADDQAETIRRREQAHFDRVAKDGGFAFLVIPSTRWFSRQPIVLSAPSRTIARYDVRAPAVLDDATRSDLARETKQALAYAAITAALSRSKTAAPHARLGEAMAHVVDGLVALAGYSYAGVDPTSFEPTFRDEDGAVIAFDALPTRARHLVAFGALPLRTLAAAYPGKDPLDAEGVVAIDEIELQLDAAAQDRVLGVLRGVLPRVQWIVTTASPVIAASAENREVFALRKLPRATEVQLFSGVEALVH
ncbi:MAG TPA: hypothetical protein VHC69_00170 [Polyangiaceae bacterium]|nr:hypothetical protein [Polyangiaceae bacterium]